MKLILDAFIILSTFLTVRFNDPMDWKTLALVGLFGLWNYVDGINYGMRKRRKEKERTNREYFIDHLMDRKS